MRLIAVLTFAFFSSLTVAGEFQLVLMLGEIDEVLIKAAKPRTDKNVLDHSCGNEEVIFKVEEYLTGSGEKERRLSRTLASYNCDSSWDGMPASLSIAMVSQWPTYYLYRGIVRLTQTREGYQVVDAIPQLLGVLFIHDQKNPDNFLVPLKEPIVRHQGADEGTEDLKYLASLGVVEFKLIEIDLNENCISGCEKENVIQAYEVTYKKGIPLSKLRGKNF